MVRVEYSMPMRTLCQVGVNQNSIHIRNVRLLTLLLVAGPHLPSGQLDPREVARLAPCPAEGVGDFAERAARPRRLDGKLEEVATNPAWLSLSKLAFFLLPR